MYIYIYIYIIDVFIYIFVFITILILIIVFILILIFIFAYLLYITTRVPHWIPPVLFTGSTKRKEGSQLRDLLRVAGTVGDRPNDGPRSQ